MFFEEVGDLTGTLTWHVIRASETRGEIGGISLRDTKTLIDNDLLPFSVR